MHIVHIEDFFHPETGYQVNILSKYQAAQGWDVTIVTMKIDYAPDYLLDFFGGENIEEKDRLFTQKTNVKIIRVDILKYLSGRVIYKESIFKMIEELNPDLLYVHGNDTYIGIRYALKAHKLNFPIVMDSHMLLAASKNKFRKFFYWGYKRFIATKIIKNNIPVIRTVEDDYVKSQLGVPIEQCPVVGFGSDLLLFNRNLQTKVSEREKLNIEQDTFLVVYAGKLDEGKGGLFLAEAIKEKFSSSKKISFLIIGNFVGQYGNQVKKVLEQSENDILIYSTQKYIDLAKYYQMSDLAVFPKACSLSFYDVQACGLPVIAEDKININIERLSHNNGFTFMSDSITDFRNKIQEIAELPKEKQRIMSDNAVNYITKNYNYAIKVSEYNDIIEKQIEKFACKKEKRV